MCCFILSNRSIYVVQELYRNSANEIITGTHSHEFPCLICQFQPYTCSNYWSHQRTGMVYLHKGKKRIAASSKITCLKLKVLAWNEMPTANSSVLYFMVLKWARWMRRSQSVHHLWLNYTFFTLMPYCSWKVKETNSLSSLFSFSNNAPCGAYAICMHVRLHNNSVDNTVHIKEYSKVQSIFSSEVTKSIDGGDLNAWPMLERTPRTHCIADWSREKVRWQHNHVMVE